jgi:predicted CXXCH cytochrome family protein
MRKGKVVFSFLLMLLFVGMFSTAAFATGEGPADNNIPNANLTGDADDGTEADTFNEIIKSDNMSKGNAGETGTHATHGSYENNTNSCASCHQTHSAASKNLLFKNGEYNTCTACHDGTLGFYNVFGSNNSSGTFGGSEEGNMSSHLATGQMTMKAAPGGNKNGVANWDVEFTCVSCHAPHGSYSDRLLSPNPNNMGNLTADKGGKRLEGVRIVNSMVGVTDEYVLYKFTLDAASAAEADYTAKKLNAGDIVIQLMKKDHHDGTYKQDKDPWLHGYEFDETHTKHYWTAFQDATGADKMHTDSIKNGAIFGKGFVAFKAGSSFLSTVNTLVKGNLSRAYVVKLAETPSKDPALAAHNVTTTDITKLWSVEDGNGIAMSEFCATCHTDYLAASVSARLEEHDPNAYEPTGTYEHAYRHTTDQDRFTCVRCHFAHGTDVTVMKDAQGKTVDQIVTDSKYFPSITDQTARRDTAMRYMTDVNPSSALKRFTNQAICWSCHTSSHSYGIRNSDTYEYQSGSGATYDGLGIVSPN